MLYVDTSVLAAYYCPEALSNQAQEIIQKNEPAISVLTEVELYSALSKKVRSKELEKGNAHRICSIFRVHVESGIYRRLFLEAPHYQLAGGWIEQMNMPLRTLDALHLALVVTHSIELVTADKNLAKSARLLGVQTHFLT